MTKEIAADVFTTDYIGTAGNRSFFLQARRAEDSVTLGVEKQQVVLLAEKLAELLLMVDREDTLAEAEPARDPALESWEEEPEDRVGAIGLAYIEENDQVMVALDPIEAAPEEDAPEEIDETEMPGSAPGSTRILLRRDQVRSFVLHALAVIGEGRPLCRLCGLPMDPEGHSCPASNGHRTIA